ncbi:MAG: hypothetical protein OHK93_007160 [Ramalina farinacea]|uniref:Uncharacterized protein n=1 Tax=Ramalina farinacea TaxID=258253 RepID=A0AA43QJY4_9LECA|nr:hypothetical protein [Ramalina farinacea]
MDVLQAIFPCIPAQRKTSTPKRDLAVDNEKLALYTDEEPSRISIAEATESIIDTLRNAEKPGADLKSSIDSIVHQAGGWSERIATAVLNALVKVLQNVEAKMGPVLKEAYERACSVANGVEGFIRDHPVFVTVLALGVLVALTPYLLEMLGFAELGIVRGKV